MIVVVKPINPARNQRSHALFKQRVTEWLDSLSAYDRLALAVMWDTPRTIVRDWIEDHGGKRSYWRVLKWVGKCGKCWIME